MASPTETGKGYVRMSIPVNGVLPGREDVDKLQKVRAMPLKASERINYKTLLGNVESGVCDWPTILTLHDIYLFRRLPPGISASHAERFAAFLGTLGIRYRTEAPLLLYWGARAEYEQATCSRNHLRAETDSELSSVVQLEEKECPLCGYPAKRNMEKWPRPSLPDNKRVDALRIALWPQGYGQRPTPFYAILSETPSRNKWGETPEELASKQEFWGTRFPRGKRSVASYYASDNPEFQREENPYVLRPVHEVDHQRRDSEPEFPFDDFEVSGDDGT